MRRQFQRRATNEPGDVACMRVCMHVLGRARTDVRVMREARSLLQAGYDVIIVDIETDTSRPRHEDFQGASLRHLMTPTYQRRTRFKPWFVVKTAFRMARATVAVTRV